jgi:hypothetical protein
MAPLPRVALRMADESPTGALEHPRRHAPIPIDDLEQAHFTREALATIRHLLSYFRCLPPGDIDFASLGHDPFQKGPEGGIVDLSLEAAASG